MRTILILIFLCSLAQFVESGGNKIPNCGTILNCYAPESCIDGTGKTLDQSKVVEVDGTTEILDDCDAIIKFHQYQTNWIYVSIESFKDATNKIVFSHRNKNDARDNSEFSCIRENGKLEGKYLNDKKNETNDKTKIECSFEVKLKIDELIFKDINRFDKIRMKVDADSTMSTEFRLDIQRCDASDFKAELDVSSTEVYEKVEYNAGEYFCKDASVFTKQYRPPTRGYEGVRKIICIGDQFSINDEAFTSKDWIYIRCVADVQYFCAYDVKGPDNEDEFIKKLVYTPPNKITRVKGSLKCPEGYQHLYIDKRQPLTNPTIECRNYGGKQFWTVTANNAILTAKSPLVYCSKKLDCSVNSKISAKSIKNGYLALQNNSLTPKCYEDGILTVDSKQITNVACDYSTGEFKYNENIVVTPATTFICTYKPKPNAKENKKNEERMQNGLAIVIGTCVGGFFLGIIIVVAVIKINSAMTRRRINRETDEHYVNFLMNEKEKDAFHKKNKTKPANKNQPVHWTNFLMHSQYFNEVDILAKAKPSHVDPPKEKSYTARKNEGKTVTKLKKYGRSYSPILDNMVTKYDKDVDAGKILYDSNMKDKMEKLRIEKAKAASKPPSK